MRIACILPFLVACAAAPPKTHQVQDRQGKLFWEYESSEGIPDGESRTYYPNDELRSVGSFRNAEFHGRFVRYHPNGEFAFRAFFWHDVLVWESKTETDEPPVKLLTELLSLHDPVEIRRRFGNPLRDAPSYEWLYLHDGRAPSPRFVLADWRVSDRPVVGGRLRVGGATAGETTAVSESVFGYVPVGAYAVSAMFTQSQLHGERKRIWGRSILDLGGARRWDTTLGQFIARTSVSLPLAREEATSALATAATLAQSPEMAATSVGSTAALRGGCSWLWNEARWGVQADLGIDRTVGGDRTPSLTFVHAAVAGAYGVRSVYALLELSSVARLDSEQGNLSSAGIGGAFRALGVEAKLLVGSSIDSNLMATLGVEYEY